MSLELLYKQRAEQLREKYDYLILNYSGGSDSHNILWTFIKHNIKLDHIVVQWPESLMDKGLYSPNTIDKSNANFHSEWDFVIKKDLQWLSLHKPEIKIEILDWAYSITEKFYNDDLFLCDVNNAPSIARSQKQHTFSPTEGSLALKGSTVGSIYGVDKIGITEKEGKWFYFFTDTGCMAHANPDNPNGTEYFYWTPDLPELVITQAFKLKQYYESRPLLRHLVKSRGERLLTEPSFRNFTYADYMREYNQLCEIYKLVCYPYWTFDRFQADKPFVLLDGFKMGTRAWDNILTNLPNFDRAQQSWEYLWKSYLGQIDMKFMRNQDTFTTVRSKWHYFSG